MAEAKRMTADEVVGYLLAVKARLPARVAELSRAAAGGGGGLGTHRRRPRPAAPEECLTHRNGYRARSGRRAPGEVELQIPKLRRNRSAVGSAARQGTDVLSAGGNRCAAGCQPAPFSEAWFRCPTASRASDCLP
jgi:hypothetical protein